ncbi:NADH-quinone oxidoreductase subunit NuoN [Uliginosibacterium sp. H1]|uniref:NADH-quinone oxidoreductase subunit NuoN n=1 Tax=Uliginosibacterium sp. H1 TaxID=3114757 RepID=UPI002E193E76|nr:NADH-quinone oxidoreductase subunit NuoN [Uliginosibacterium sp. H1]
MEFQIPNFAPAAAEIFVAAMALVLLMVAAFARPGGGRCAAFWVSQATLLVAAVLSLPVDWSAGVWETLRSSEGGIGMWLLSWLASGKVTFTFGLSFLSDPLGGMLKSLVCLAVMAVLLYGRRYLNDRKLESPEYYVVAICATLGMLVLISASSLLTIYMGLELLSLSSYALVAVDRDNPRATEAAMKYFVLGALASGLLLYGISMVYGATGTLDIIEVARGLYEQQVNRTVLLFGLVFVVAGVAFKLGVVPFHMWIPDVYHGAPTSVTLLISTAPKLAAFAMAFRLLALGMWDLAPQWQKMLMIAAVASIVLGNLAAIAQTNLKRMLAYSGISHMGFMLLGLMAAKGSPHDLFNAYASSLFYVVIYVLTTLASFGILLMMSREGFEAENIDDFRGLNRRNSWWAAMMAIVMFSTAGLPFFVGFFSKFFVLQAVLSAGHLSLAVVAVLMSLVGAFYYLRVVKVMYFDEPVDDTPVRASRGFGLVLSSNVLAVAVLGIMPGWLMNFCVLVLRSSFG